MFEYSTLSSLHLEITSKCNAKCPMCSRTNNPMLNLISWTLQDFKTIVPVELVKKLNHITFCGNFGDPIANNDVIKMLRYVSRNNESISVAVHSNVSLRTPEWWKELGEAFPKNGWMYFSIDGLADTNHLYRVGTNYEKIMENARAFIATGANAGWDFIKFKHNEHQEDEIRKLAADMGFKKFTMKNSSRFYGRAKVDVLDKRGNLSHILEPPTDTDFKFMTVDEIDESIKMINNIKIECYVQKIKELFVTADGLLLPCCWVAAVPGTQYSSEVKPYVIDLFNSQYTDLINKLGGTDKINIYKMGGIEKIVETKEWQEVWDIVWNQEIKLLPCVKACGKFPKGFEFAQPIDQSIKIDSI